MSIPMPEQLERLRQISIDRLGLSESTQAVLKWYGITHVLDCIGRLYIMVHFRRNSALWPRFVRLLFAEVKPKLMAMGCWDLVLDADTWRVLSERTYYLNTRRIIQWQGQDIDLYEILLEELGLPDPPYSFRTVGASIEHIVTSLRFFPHLWLEIYGGTAKQPARPLYGMENYMFRVVQPRLAELGYWKLIEEHIDDFIEESGFEGWFDWDDDGQRET